MRFSSLFGARSGILCVQIDDIRKLPCAKPLAIGMQSYGHSPLSFHAIFKPASLLFFNLFGLD
jgi:hypothetical protein